MKVEKDLFVHYLYVVKAAADQVLDFVSNTLAQRIACGKIYEKLPMALQYVQQIRTLLTGERSHLSLCLLILIIITTTARIIPPIAATVPMQIRNNSTRSIISENL